MKKNISQRAGKNNFNSLKGLWKECISLEDLGSSFTEHLEHKKKIISLLDHEFYLFITRQYQLIFTSQEVKEKIIQRYNSVENPFQYIEQSEEPVLSDLKTEEEIVEYRESLACRACFFADLKNNPKIVRKKMITLIFQVIVPLENLAEHDLAEVEGYEKRIVLEAIQTDLALELIHHSLKEVVSMYYDSLSEAEQRESDERVALLKLKEQKKEEARKAREEKKKEEIKQRNLRKEQQKQQKQEVQKKKEALAQKRKAEQKRLKEIRRKKRLEEENRKREEWQEQKQRWEEEKIRKEQEEIQKQLILKEERKRQMALQEEEYLRQVEQERLQHKQERLKREKKWKKASKDYQNRIHEQEVKEAILAVISSRPEEEYPKVRKYKRKFILHIGPTNSGKTYEALERLKQSKNGGYFGPLRLLAMEVFDKCNYSGIPCSLITGEERIEMPGELCKAGTIEMLDIEENFDVVVIDECQMIQDLQRGQYWTKAILGIKAREIHLCMANESAALIIELIKRCGDEYEISYHVRKTRLIVEDKLFSIETDIQKGDALIVFSQRKVLKLADKLRKRGFLCSVIYGNMPPKSRRMQVDLYLKGKTNIVVSTDAIGMGLNLPIRRIVFMSVMKFDGQQRNLLIPSEIKQIAGRAGRFKMYNEGYVATVERPDIIRQALSEQVPTITKATLEFPNQILDIQEELGVLISSWKNMSDPPMYQKMDVTEILLLYSWFKEVRKDWKTFSNREIFKLISCPVDTRKGEVAALWKKYCAAYDKVEKLEIPHCFNYSNYNLEVYYKMLELYKGFSLTVGLPIQEEWLEDEKVKIEKMISKSITKKFGSVKHCQKCGKQLPPDVQNQICGDCLMKYLLNSKLMKSSSYSTKKNS